MINVSDRWKQVHGDVLVPEAYIELTVGVTEEGIQDEAVASSMWAENYSDMGAVTDVHHTVEPRLWATNELNLWVLDGSRNIRNNETAVGYVSERTGDGEIVLKFARVHEQAIKGLTITWCKEYGEYATDFSIRVYRKGSFITMKEITGNTGIETVVEMDISDYDQITINIDGWSIPHHRPRVEKILLGMDVIYTKQDIMKFKHQQTGSVISGELPKNSIEFSLDNSNNRWNPNNPTGDGRYLSDRQKIKVRYGYNIDGAIEWIRAGTFYLSEWRTPANGIEASFTARDLLEYMIDVPYEGIKTGTLFRIASAAVTQADLPDDAVVKLSDRLKDYSASFEDDYSIAEVLQMCANAACCSMYQNRDGELIIEYTNNPMGDYRLTSNVAYSYPEFDLSKPLKSIEVSYGGDNSKYIHSVGSSGEKQTLNNPLISTAEQAEEVARWIENTLKFRKHVSGEFRADPRLDLFDRVAVESKFGVNNAVIITDIAYNFTGVFKGTYTGIITEFTAVEAAYCGEIFVGEV